MPSIAGTARPKRRRRRSHLTADHLLDGLAIVVSIGLFVGLLWWMTVVGSS